MPKKQRTDDPPIVPQTAEERQTLRQQQREVGNFIAANKNSIGDVNSNAFNEARTKNNEAEKKVTHVRESVLDVENYKAITMATTKQASALIVVNQSVSIEKLIRELRKRACTDDEEDFSWETIGRGCSFAFSTPPRVEFLCGPLSKPPAEKKERNKRKSAAAEDDESEGEEETPEDVNEVDEATESTQKRLVVLTKKLQEVKSENFFKLLVNPASFTQTVENVFDFSFNVKAGQASLDLDANEQPVVSFVDSSRSMMQNDDTELPSTQVVIALSPKDIADAVKRYNITESAIPDRSDEPTYQQNYEGNLRGNKKKPAAHDAD